MTVYLLSWDNNDWPESRFTTLLGIYTTPEAREQAKDRYSRVKPWPISSFPAGEYEEIDVKVNQDLEVAVPHKPLAQR